MTLVLRHSLIALPEPGFVQRTDPFGYTIRQQHLDFSAPLGAPVVVELARRFRLEKTVPNAARSPSRNRSSSTSIAVRPSQFGPR